MYRAKLRNWACVGSATGVGVVMVLAVASAGCGTERCAGVGDRDSLDFSGFERFAFRRNETFSACKRRGLADAELIREPDGSMTCRGTVYESMAGTCPELRRIGTRTLSDQEQAAVLAAFREVRHVPIPVFAAFLSGLGRPSDQPVEGGIFAWDGIHVFGPVATDLCIGGLTRESYDSVIAALSAVLQ